VKSSIPSALVSLDSSTLLCASHFADTHLLTLNPTPHPKQTLITNLAPISDFLVLPPGHPQSGALITCSGGFTQGTLRVVRQGVGIDDYASVDFEGIRGVWTLKQGVNGMDIDGAGGGCLVLGLIERTVFLEIDSDGGLEAVEGVGGLLGGEETIALREVEGVIVQVTTERVHVTQRGGKVAEFPGKVSAAQISESQILVSSGRNMTLLSLDCQVLQQWTLPEEITCLDILDDTIAIGLWNSTVKLITLSTGNLSTTTTIPTSLSAPARSIILSTILPGQKTLLIGCRDGTLTTYNLPSPTKKTISLGTQPLRLFPLNTPSRQIIFAASDRPTLLHLPAKPKPNGEKLALSPLSIRDVSSLTVLDHPAYPDSLVIATKEGFRIGRMDTMSKLQVRSVGMPAGELPRRIARMDVPGEGGSGVVGVISLRIVVEVDGSERTEGYLRVWDEDSWHCIHPTPFSYYVVGKCLCFRYRCRSVCDE
jgi:DNA damage-binding protein 1